MDDMKGELIWCDFEVGDRKTSNPSWMLIGTNNFHSSKGLLVADSTYSQRFEVKDRCCQVSSYTPGVICSDSMDWSRPEGVIDDVLSMPPRFVRNVLKTHQMRLRLASSKTLLITYN